MFVNLFVIMMLVITQISGTISTFPSFYTTTSRAYEKLKGQESSSDKDVSMRIRSYEQDDIVVLSVTYSQSKASRDVNRLRFVSEKALEPPSSSESRKDKIMFLFGEHAREFVSVEAALRLSSVLIGDDESEELNELGREVLEKYDVVSIPVANPMGRQKAENGEFCYRDNANGVDLNRNWDAHWDASLNDGNTNSGSGPFSEPETKILRDVMTETSPHIFMTVHSGTLGMYTPFAYSTSVPTGPEESEMLSMILPLDEKYCQCPMGAAGKEVGYLCPGTCLDYAYDVLNVPFAFAFEIYGDENERRKCKEEFERQKMRFQEKESYMNDVVSFLQVETEALHSCFLQNRVETSTKHLSRMSDEECFAFFNPTSKEELDEVTKNWVGVFLKLALKVSEVSSSSGTTKTTVVSDVRSSTSTSISTTVDKEMGLKIVGSKIV